MATKKTKAVVSEDVVEEAPVEKPKKKAKTFHLEIWINDTINAFDTDDLRDTMTAFEAPDIIKTKVIFKYNKGTVKREKVMDTFDARRVFHNKTALTLLIDTMIEELG